MCVMQVFDLLELQLGELKVWVELTHQLSKREG